MLLLEPYQGYYVPFNLNERFVLYYYPPNSWKLSNQKLFSEYHQHLKQAASSQPHAQSLQVLQDSRVSQSCVLLRVIPPPFLILQVLSVHLLFTIKIKHQKIFSPPSWRLCYSGRHQSENNTTKSQQRRSIPYILQQLLLHIHFVVLSHLSVLSDRKLQLRDDTSRGLTERRTIPNTT